MITFLFQNLIDIRKQVDQSKIYGNNPLGQPELGGTGDTGNVLGTIIGSLVNVAITLAGITVLLYFLWAGFNWLTSGGDKQKVEDARNRMTNAIIGMAIVAASLAISALVNNFFGTNVEIPGMNQGGGSSSGSSGSSTKSSDCGGGLNIGQESDGYRCVAGGTACGPGNPNGFPYPFNCPVNLVGKK